MLFVDWRTAFKIFIANLVMTRALFWFISCSFLYARTIVGWIGSIFRGSILFRFFARFSPILLKYWLNVSAFGVLRGDNDGLVIRFLIFQNFSPCTCDGMCNLISDFNLSLCFLQLGCRSFVEKAYSFVSFGI